MVRFGLVFALLLFSLPAQAQQQRCIGPRTVTNANEALSWDLGSQNQGTNDVFTVTLKNISGTYSAQVRANLETTTGNIIPNDASTNITITAMTQATAGTSFRQFNGPWNNVILDITCATCSVVYNICGKDL